MYKKMTEFCILVMFGIQVAGCSSKGLDSTPLGSERWRSVVLNSIPGLRAVEAPLGMHIASEMLRHEVDAEGRIPLNDNVVVEFESVSPVGLLNESAEAGSDLVRQYSAYCSESGNVILVYNLVDVDNGSCRAYSGRWQHDVVMDSDCTSLGVFKSESRCR